MVLDADIVHNTYFLIHYLLLLAVLQIHIGFNADTDPDQAFFVNADPETDTDPESDPDPDPGF
jgi:hypothetical protein